MRQARPLDRWQAQWSGNMFFNPAMTAARVDGLATDAVFSRAKSERTY